MKITLDPKVDITITQAVVPVDHEHIHHLRVVLDGSRAEEVYAFLWVVTGSEDEPTVWDEHWRGNLAACLRNFAEVTGDMVADALHALAPNQAAAR